MTKNVQSLVKAKIEVEGMRNIIFNALPQNITNGDVIKAMFPNIEIIINTETREVSVDNSENTYMHFFDLDWWNAPYKR